MFSIDTTQNSNSFTNSGTSIKKIGGGNSWSTAMSYGNIGFSSGVNYYEVVIDSLNNDKSGFAIGINYKGKVTYSNDIVIGMSGYGYNTNKTTFSNFIKQGDVIGVELNFIKGICSFFQNGKLLDIFAQIYQGTTYYPCFHLYYVGDGLTIFPTLQSNVFTWDIFTPGNSSCYKLSNNQNTVLKVQGGNSWDNAMVYGTQFFTSGTNQFEVKIDSINNDKSGFFIGLARNNKGIYKYDQDLGIGLSGYCCGMLTDVHNFIGNVGDIYRIIVDFQKGKCQFLYNGKTTNLSFNLIDGEIYYPVIHLYYVGDGCTLQFPTILSNQSFQNIIQSSSFNNIQSSPLNTNPKNNGLCFSLSNNNKTVKKIQGGNTWDNAYIYGTKGYSQGIISWEVLIDSINNDKSGFVIGVSKCNNGTITFKNDLAIGMSGSAYGLSSITHNYKAKKGDIYGILLDFYQSIVKFYYNGQDTLITGPILKGTIYYPVIHLYYINDGFTLSYGKIPSSPLQIVNSISQQNISQPCNISLNTNPKNNGYCFQLTNNSVKKIAGGNTWDNAYIYGTQGFSSGQVYWEIQIDNVNIDGSGFIFGISKCNNGSVPFKDDITIGMKGYGYNTSMKSHNFKGLKGDKFGILLDFDQSIVKFYFNGQDTLITGPILKGTIYYPVIHLYYLNDAFTLNFPNIPLNTLSNTLPEFSLNTNPKNNGNCFKLSNNSVTKIQGGNTWDNAYIYGTQGYSSGIISWDIIIDNVNTDGSGFVIGVSKCNNGTITFKNDLAIGMSGSAYGLNSITHGYKGKKGDKYTIILDFNSMTVFFKFNDQDTRITGSLQNGITYYPVIHLYYVNDGFTFISKDVNSKIIRNNFILNTNPKNNAYCFSLSNNNKTVKKIEGGNTWNNAYIYGTQGFSSGQVYWEIQIDNVNKDGSGFVIGASKCNNGTITFRNDLTIGMSGNAYGLSQPTHSFKPKNGDKIKVLLDFDNLLITFTVNGTDIGLKGVLIQGVTYYPVIHLYYVNDGFTLLSDEGFNQTPLIKKQKFEIPIQVISTPFGLNINPKNIESCFYLTNHQTVEKISGGNKWENGPIYGKKGFNSGQVYWEIQIDNVNKDGSGFIIGISECNNGSISFKNDLAIGMSGITYGLNTKSHSYKPIKGDKIGIFLNFNESKVEFIHNGYLMNLYGPLKSGVTYYPCFHLYYVKDGFTILFLNNDEPLKDIIRDVRIIPKNNQLFKWNLLNMIVPRVGNGSILYNDLIYILFGEEYSKSIDTVFTLNIQTNEMKYLSLSNGPSSRRFMTCERYQDSILIYGGDVQTSDLWKLDLKNNKWDLLENNCPPKSRHYHSSCIYGDYLFIFGGISEKQHSNDLWCYNIIKKEWKEMNSQIKPSPRRYSTLSCYNDKLYLTCGRDDSKRFFDLWEYDLLDQKWSEIITFGLKRPLPMSAHSSCMLGQCIFVFGGNDGNNVLPNILYRYNTVTNEWKGINTSGNNPEGRYWHSSIIDEKSQELYILGGQGISTTTPNCFKIQIE